MELFERATRLKLRFTTNSGDLDAEYLWDLPLTSTRGPSLDAIAIGLHNQIKAENISFVTDERPADDLVQLRFDIVKHIIGVKKAERKEAAEAKDRSDKKQRIMGILARKADEALEAASEDELRKLLAEL